MSKTVHGTKPLVCNVSTVCLNYNCDYENSNLYFITMKMAPIRLYNFKTKKEFREFFLFSSNVGARFLLYLVHAWSYLCSDI